MTIAFYAGNLIDQATLTPSTENLLFPVKNVKNPMRTKVFRSNSNNDSIILDFIEDSEIDSIIIADNWKSGFGITNATLELNGTNTWGSPAYSQAINMNSKFGLGLTEFATLQSFRFGRLVLTSSLGYCELANIFVGKKITPGNRSLNFGWSVQDNDLSIVKENRYGQKFVDLVSRQKVFNISFSNLTKDEVDSLYAIHDEVGLSKPFFVTIGSASMANELERYAGMVYLKSMPLITNKSFNRFNLSMSMEEAK